jgi:methylmalonyl-CoA mutase N-terminal domain/subunit
VANVSDPLGGSYYVEALTRQLEDEAEATFAEIGRIGGVVRGIETGWFQRQIAQSATRYQREVEERRRVIVGVNDFVVDEPEVPIPLLRIGAEAEEAQAARLKQLRAARDGDQVRRRLDALTEAARRGSNVIPAMLDASRAYATLYEIREALERVYGSYREPIFF